MLGLLSLVLISGLIVAGNSFAKGSSGRPSAFTLATPSAQCVNGATQVQLQWGTSTGATSYVVQNEPTTKQLWNTVTTVAAITTSYTDTSLAGKTGTYRYRITAKNGRLTTGSNAQRVVPQQCASSPFAASLFGHRSSSSVSTQKKNSSSIRSSSSSSKTSSSSSKAASSMSSAISSVASTSSSVSVPPVLNGLSWGAYVGDNLTDSATFESTVGKKIHIQAIFVGGTDDFPSEYGATVRDQGKVLAIFWEPTGVSLDSVNAGTLDGAITQFAAGAKNYGGPIIFLPFHEMNGNWDSWDGTVGTNTPAKLIAAWKHVHDLFAGATNVKFGWAVNSDSVPDTAANSIGAYYPGDAYVDYVGVDGFNFGDPWQSFDSVFATALQQLNTYGKPVYIFSMASAAGTGKAAWITDALTTQMVKYPKIAGWIWFNQNKEQNWLINSDPLSLQAFQAAIQ